MPTYTAKLTYRLIAFTKQFPCSDLKMTEPWRSKCRFHNLDFLKNWRIVCLNCVISHYTQYRSSMSTFPKTTVHVKVGLFWQWPTLWQTKVIFVSILYKSVWTIRLQQICLNLWNWFRLVMHFEFDSLTVCWKSYLRVILHLV